MVIVVPALAASEDGDPPVVTRVIAGLEATLTPQMSGRVDQPRSVKAKRYAEEGSPKHHPDSSSEAVAGCRERCAECELQEACDRQRKPVIFAEPDMDGIARQVGGVAAQERGLGVQRATGDDPASVSPPSAVVRRVGIALVVRVLMVDAVCGDPEDRSALEGQGAAGAEEVLNPLGSFVAAMREQAMVRHADADIDGQEVHHGSHGDVRPGEEEECGDCADVEERHRDSGDPVDAALLVLTAHTEVFTNLASSGSSGGERSICVGSWRLNDFFGGDKGKTHDVLRFLRSF